MKTPAASKVKRAERGPSLAQALERAKAYWATRSGWRVMECRASLCVLLLGKTRTVDTLKSSDATTLLTELAKRRLSRKSQGDYYGTFKRLLKLNGVTTYDWPRAPEVPRRSRDPIAQGDFVRVVGWLHERGYSETAQLCEVLYATGLRVAVEALRGDNLTLCQSDRGVSIKVVGKGGHERIIPWRADGVRGQAGALSSLSALSYRSHLRRWHKACKALDIKSRLATPHALRHSFATRALRASGGNLRLVQELLGHSNPGTTARYAEISMSDKVALLQKMELTHEIPLP